MRFRKTSFLVKLLLVIVAVYAVITLVNLQDRINSTKAQAAELEEQVLYAQQENALVAQELKDIDSDSSTKKIARSRLGMVELGEIVFFDADAE